MNWGWKIALGYGCFVAFILFMVYSANQVDFQLVTPDYYSAEIAFQDQITKKQSALNTGNDIELRVEENGVRLHFNNYTPASETSGKAYFFRPSASEMDREFEWRMDGEGNMILDKKHFVRGHYVFKLDGVMDGNAFFVEHPIFIP